MKFNLINQPACQMQIQKGYTVSEKDLATRDAGARESVVLDDVVAPRDSISSEPSGVPVLHLQGFTYVDH
eukprot:2766940-Rhodomonas_salina.4